MKSEFPIKNTVTDKDLERLGYFDLEESEMEEYWIKQTKGTIDIKDEGCGAFGILIITGNQRGEIWHDGMYADMGIYKDKIKFWDLIN